MIKREDLTSQKMRRIAPEMDPLRIGMGWSIDDLSKPQIMVESTFGDSHPGSAGLFELVSETCGRHYRGGRKIRALFCDRYLRRSGAGARRHKLLTCKPRCDLQHDRDTRKRNAVRRSRFPRKLRQGYARTPYGNRQSQHSVGHGDWRRHGRLPHRQAHRRCEKGSAHARTDRHILGAV